MLSRTNRRGFSTSFIRLKGKNEVIKIYLFIFIYVRNERAGMYIRQVYDQTGNKKAVNGLRSGQGMGNGRGLENQVSRFLLGPGSLHGKSYDIFSFLSCKCFPCRFSFHPLRSPPLPSLSTTIADFFSFFSTAFDLWVGLAKKSVHCFIKRRAFLLQFFFFFNIQYKHL